MLTTLTEHGYVNYVYVSALDSKGNVYLALTHERTDQPNKPTEVEIVQRAADGSWQQIFVFDEPTYGKAGYGGITPLPNGDLFYCGSHRVTDQYGERQAARYGTLHKGANGWQLL